MFCASVYVVKALFTQHGVRDVPPQRHREHGGCTEEEKSISRLTLTGRAKLKETLRIEDS